LSLEFLLLYLRKLPACLTYASHALRGCILRLSSCPSSRAPCPPEAPTFYALKPYAKAWTAFTLDKQHFIFCTTLWCASVYVQDVPILGEALRRGGGLSPTLYLFCSFTTLSSPLSLCTKSPYNSSTPPLVTDLPGHPAGWRSA